MLNNLDQMGDEIVDKTESGENMQCHVTEEEDAENNLPAQTNNKQNSNVQIWQR